MGVLQAEQRPPNTAQETSGMFSTAPIRWPHAGQRDLGATRLNFSAGGRASPRSSAHCACQSRSIIFGNRWMATFRNDPTASPNTKHSEEYTAGSTRALEISAMRAKKKGYGRTVTLARG